MTDINVHSVASVNNHSHSALLNKEVEHFPSDILIHVWFLHDNMDQNSEKTDVFKLPSPLVFTPQFSVDKVSCGVSLAAFLTSKKFKLNYSLNKFLCQQTAKFLRGF
jgi:hypothetical protein